jgi:hypothetical protein
LFSTAEKEKLLENRAALPFPLPSLLIRPPTAAV